MDNNIIMPSGSRNVTMDTFTLTHDCNLYNAE